MVKSLAEKGTDGQTPFPRGSAALLVRKRAESFGSAAEKVSVPREIGAFELGCGFLACSELSARRFKRLRRFSRFAAFGTEVGGMCLGVLLQLIQEFSVFGVPRAQSRERRVGKAF
jgi:hypothetical protein